MTGFITAAVRGGMATAAAMLPRRYWPALEGRLPVSNAAFPTSVLTMFAGAALGITGFLAHLAEVTSQNNALYLEAAARSDAATMPLPSALSGLSLFTFILLTPQGWLSTYLALSGLVRSIGSQFDDAHGDLLLTAADAGIRGAWRRVVRRGEIDNRHLLEGPRVRDRVLSGPQAGAPQADLVIVAARVKDGWEPGAVVLTNRGEFRIVEIEDRMIDDRLRRLYCLVKHQDLEVFRRTVHYEFDGVTASLTISSSASSPAPNLTTPRNSMDVPG